MTASDEINHIHHLLSTPYFKEKKNHIEKMQEEVWTDSDRMPEIIETEKIEYSDN
ncbi:hypothetical protein ACNARU_18890 [Proteus sp. WDL240414]|uniref:Uncharacterized protein n=1 Tax=Proteus genomosp. 6 TaxID=1311820 RepID=A0ABV1LEB6_9GAMM|nr:hypothetical protein [Proteus mirabilis]MBG2711997.1 hypothetical protein [Proteus mirabilis]MBG2768858.1 hypothetical protein [Proteus mirabilis]MBI6508269.1 hypothetical protein [Proteus mirabilis]